jgi:aspartyl protease family protein
MALYCSARNPWRQPWLLLLITCLLIVTPVPGVLSPGQAQSNTVGLNTQLDQAVRGQNWAQAIKIIDQMIVAQPQQVQRLRAYRQQLVQLQQAGVRTPVRPSSDAAEPSGPASLVARVPIKRRSGGVPVIDVKFNGRLSFEMLVDSGASMTVITRPMANSLGISAADVVDEIRFDTANGKVVKPIVVLNSIEFGKIRRSMVDVAVSPSGMDIGLLGQDFLGRYDVSIRRDVIEFHRR